MKFMLGAASKRIFGVFMLTASVLFGSVWQELTLYWTGT